MVEMQRKVNFLMKVVEEQDHEITAWREQMRTCETAKSSQTPVVKATDKRKNVVQENQPEQQSDLCCFSLSLAATGYDHEFH